ncbi:MAG: filamentous hemagglutinin N-terminal domain-containing protein [Deltaproteobacteria bacterium]|jgi:filamentous hemagglutinin family protein|nr:filamentous hemagglutinin N-terminal domain-containing protein [Deltaproteobacteria bacterium]
MKTNEYVFSSLRRFLNTSGIAVLIILLLSPYPAIAAPYGGQVTSGQAVINQNGAVTNIDQSTNKATINWRGFSVAPQETVNFNQPSVKSMTLNRVIGNEKSLIEGALNAKGQVFLLNSNGVLFSRGAKVNVGGLVASTLDMSDEDFNKGNFVFKDPGSGQVINQGELTATDGGYVVLLGTQAINEGVISAKAGTVSLNSAEKVTLSFDGESLVQVSLDEGTLNALVENKNAIFADGGRVFLTAKSAGDIWDAQVNNEGRVQARTLADLNGGPGQKGRIELFAHGGTTKADGILDASAPDGGDGGFIETSGAVVKIAESGTITTKAKNGRSGTWLLDPEYIIINANGSGANAISVANVQDKFAENGKAEFDASKDLTVDAAITWSGDFLLSLIAGNDLTVNAEIKGTGDASKINLEAGNDLNVNAPITLTGANAIMTLKYGNNFNLLTPASFSGTVTDQATGMPVAKEDKRTTKTYGQISLSPSASLTINSETYELISDMANLKSKIEYNLSGKYALGNDIASSETYSRVVVDGSFTGTLFGLGHIISNLYINNTTSTPENVGLFNLIDKYGLVRDLGLLDAIITTYSTTIGILAGSSSGTIYNTYVSGTISGGTQNVGGLVGSFGDLFAGYIDYTPTIESSFSDITLINTSNGLSSQGGLVGRQNPDTLIINSHSNMTIDLPTTISVGSTIGGLVGLCYASIKYSYAKSNITTFLTDVGGLIGKLQSNSEAQIPSTIENTFAYGNVSGRNNVGGLIGSVEYNKSYGENAQYIKNSYAIGGDVSVYPNARLKGQAGGLIGSISGLSTATYPTFNITNCYANKNVITYDTTTGGVAGNVGGLIGYGNYIKIEYSYALGSVTAKNPRTQYSTANLQSIGGLVGSIGGSVVENSWTDVVVETNGSFAGGLFGQFTKIDNKTNLISNSYALGAVIGVDYVGGLVGRVGGEIINSWASGNVTGNLYVGGLAGYGNYAIITGSSASGSVSGNTDVGGLVGRLAGGQLSDSYWNTQTTGQNNAAGILEFDSTATAIGFNSSQFNDAEYVEAALNGSLDALLANREIARQEAIERENERLEAIARAEATAREEALAIEEARIAEIVRTETIAQVGLISDSQIVTESETASPIVASFTSLDNAVAKPFSLENLFSGDSVSVDTLASAFSDAAYYSSSTQRIDMGESSFYLEENK